MFNKLGCRSLLASLVVLFAMSGLAFAGGEWCRSPRYGRSHYSYYAPAPRYRPVYPVRH
jgi:hypothetical protein